MTDYRDLSPDQLRKLRPSVGDVAREKIDAVIAERARAILDEAEPARGAISLILPLPPNETNPGTGKGHWRTRHRERTAYFATLDALLTTRMIPKPPANPWKRARMKATLYVWNIMDEDGAMARLKRPVDWLVNNGYLENDRRRNIEWAGLPEQYIDRKAQRIELSIEPIAKEEAA